MVTVTREGANVVISPHRVFSEVTDVLFTRYLEL